MRKDQWRTTGLFDAVEVFSLFVGEFSFISKGLQKRLNPVLRRRFQGLRLRHLRKFLISSAMPLQSRRNDVGVTGGSFSFAGPS